MPQHFQCAPVSVLLAVQAITAGLVQQHGLDASQLKVQLLLPGMRQPPAPPGAVQQHLQAAAAAAAGQQQAAAGREQLPWVVNPAVVLRQAAAGVLFKGACAGLPVCSISLPAVQTCLSRGQEDWLVCLLHLLSPLYA